MKPNPVNLSLIRFAFSAKGISSRRAPILFWLGYFGLLATIVIWVTK